MSLRICIIEDDHPIAAMYEFKLVQQGYDVRIAYDGQAGLELLYDYRPQLVLLDLKMPVMSGEELLEKIRATDWGIKMRVIVLTNISKDEAPQKLRFLNVDRYIVKAHYTPSQVADIVNEVVNGVR